MNIIGLEKDSMVNGDGLRLIIWVAGCERHCRGCHNKEAQDRSKGHEFTTADLAEIMNILTEREYLSGITFLGGEPLEVYNRDEVARIAKILRTSFPDKTQWVYTGYSWEEVIELPVMKYIDVLVDGEFRQEEADKTLHWKGSANQRIIDVQKSLKANSVVLFEDECRSDSGANYEVSEGCCED